MRVNQDFYDLDPRDPLRFAKAYAGLGDSVQKQLDDLLAGNFEDLNPNAVDLIERRLRGFNADLDEALDEYGEWRKKL